MNTIILTLNRMTKIKKDKDGKLRAEKMMKKMAAMLSLRYNEIQRLAQVKNITGQHQSLSISDNGN